MATNDTPQAHMPTHTIETPGGISELAQGIWRRHAISPGVASSIFSLRLVQRLGRMSHDRLPLLAAIQRRWMPVGEPFARGQASLRYLRLAAIRSETGRSARITTDGVRTSAQVVQLAAWPPASPTATRRAASLDAVNEGSDQLAPEKPLAVGPAIAAAAAGPTVGLVDRTTVTSIAAGAGTSPQIVLLRHREESTVAQRAFEPGPEPAGAPGGQVQPLAPPLQPPAGEPSTQPALLAEQQTAGPESGQTARQSEENRETQAAPVQTMPAARPAADLTAALPQPGEVRAPAVEVLQRSELRVASAETTAAAIAGLQSASPSEAVSPRASQPSAVAGPRPSDPSEEASLRLSYASPPAVAGRRSSLPPQGRPAIPEPGLGRTIVQRSPFRPQGPAARAMQSVEGASTPMRVARRGSDSSPEPGGSPAQLPDAAVGPQLAPQAAQLSRDNSISPLDDSAGPGMPAAPLQGHEQSSLGQVARSDSSAPQLLLLQHRPGLSGGHGDVSAEPASPGQPRPSAGSSLPVRQERTVVDTPRSSMDLSMMILRRHQLRPVEQAWGLVLASADTGRSMGRVVVDSRQGTTPPNRCRSKGHQDRVS